MSRPGYVQYYVQQGQPRQIMLDELCARLGLEPTHKGRIAAIEAAVGHALFTCRKYDIDKRKKGEDDGVVLPTLQEGSPIGTGLVLS